MRRRRWPSTPCLLPTAAPRPRDPLARWSRRTPARTRPRLLPLPRRQSSPRTRGATVNGTMIGSLHRPTKPRLPAGRRDSWRRGAAARPGTARTRRPQTQRSWIRVRDAPSPGVVHTSCRQKGGQFTQAATNRWQPLPHAAGLRAAISATTGRGRQITRSRITRLVTSSDHQIDQPLTSSSDHAIQGMN
jgi:hypothetical protein